MVEITTGWLEIYPVPHATAQNTTPEITESENSSHFQDNVADAWAENMALNVYVYHNPYHAPPSG